MSQKRLLPYKNIWPSLAERVFIAESARVIGDVVIGFGSGIWFNTIVRGDVNFIRIGKYTNIQDNSVIHVQSNGAPTNIGDYVTVGHTVVLHACNVADNCLIGMGAILLDGSEVGENCIVGAGTLIAPGKIIPPNSMVLGSPGQVMRAVYPEEIEKIRKTAMRYYELSLDYYSPVK